MKSILRGEDTKREFTVVIEKNEDGYYVGSVPELWGCHTQAKSLDELMERVKEAILLCPEVNCAIGIVSSGSILFRESPDGRAITNCYCGKLDFSRQEFDPKGGEI